MMNRKKIFLIWVLILSPFVGLFILVQLTSLEIFGDLPNLEELENPKSNLATEIISEDGVLLGRYFFENRSPVRYDELPKNLIEALLSTEDIRFEEHSGIDSRALLRAIFGLFFGKTNSGGASTITQQLAKMLFTEHPSSGLGRIMQKLKEWVIAAQLEKRYTKKEIITMYLNKFDWVNNAVGIKSAAQIYFNKEPINLKLEESAMLVGMLKNPALYNPNRREQLTKERRNIVLYQMNKYKFISDSTFNALKTRPIILDFKRASHNDGLAPYFREYLREELKKWCANKLKPDGLKYNIYTDGLKVYTTINSSLQKLQRKQKIFIFQHYKKIFINIGLDIKKHHFQMILSKIR